MAEHAERVCNAKSLEEIEEAVMAAQECVETEEKLITLFNLGGLRKEEQERFCPLLREIREQRKKAYNFFLRNN